MITTEGRQALAQASASRPEFERDVHDEAELGDVAQPLTWWEALFERTLTRRLMVLLVLAVVWEGYATWLDNPLLFPQLSVVMVAWWDGMRSGLLPRRVWATIQVLLVGYGIGIALAAVLTTISVATRFGTDLLSTLTSMFNPLPAIALLPVA